MLIKYCKICKKEKRINEFRTVKNKIGKEYFLNFCIDCLKQKQKKYRDKNKNQISKKNKEYYKNIKLLSEKNQKSILYRTANKEHKKKYDAEYRIKNKSRYQEYCKDNKEKIAGNRHRYYLTTIKEKSVYNKKYASNNKSKIYAKNYKYQKSRLKRDVSFKLRAAISKMISKALNKKNISCVKYFPYTIAELKQHLEKQFESWMNWNNWGRYQVNSWNDQDIKTWKWQIDHIVPQSCLPYISMEDENFKKCWALENLRPLSAKQNLLDGITKIRHI